MILLRMNRLAALVLLMMNGALLCRGVAAWTTHRFSIRTYHRTTSLLRSSWADDDDDWGADQRIVRKRGGGDNQRESGGWDPRENFDGGRDRRSPRNRDRGDWRRDDNRGGRNSNNRDRGDWRRGGDRRRDDRRGGGDRRRRQDNRDERWDRNSNNKGNHRGNSEDPSSKIDMKGLEAEGFVHLYGLAPILSALKSKRRDFSPRENEEDMLNERFGSNDYDDDDDDKNTEAKTPTKPEAQYTPYLFLQDRTAGGGSGRSGDKAAAAAEVKQLAEELGIPVAYSDKGSMNGLSGNRPHQGFVLRCGALKFEPLSRIPTTDNPQEGRTTPNLWLVLDEVVDPQNLGALLRSSFFLGGNNNNDNQRLGILVCAKNSAPPSPVVSAASAGALELLDVYSTNSLPRTLAAAREDGFRIIGAASSKPRALEDEESIQLYDLQDLPMGLDDRPILLVLGSEGHGLRPLVAKLCTDFVRIPRGDDGGDNDEEGGSSSAIVDSLNVSVTGGILLWQLLYGSMP